MEELLKVFTEKGEQLNLWQMSIRGILIFITTIAVVRSGKRKFLGKNSALDIILAVIIGSVASRGINGSADFFSTVITIAALIFAHWFISLISIKNRAIGSFFEGYGYPLIENGKIDSAKLQKAHLREEDLLEAARLRANISDLNKVKDAYLESNGSISVIKSD